MLTLSQYLEKNGVHFGEDYEGFSGQTPVEPIVLDYFARRPNVKEILEIGFNAGHSTETMFLANPNANITSFDLGRVRAVKYAKDYMDIAFPGRHTLILGDSVKTVLKYKQDNPTKQFDLIFIDGGHTYAVAKMDLLRTSSLAHKDTIVIVDDITEHPGWSTGWTLEPTQVWTEGKRFGEVTELGHALDRPGFGLVWGKYLKAIQTDGTFAPMPERNIV